MTGQSFFSSCNIQTRIPPEEEEKRTEGECEPPYDGEHMMILPLCRRRHNTRPTASALEKAILRCHPLLGERVVVAEVLDGQGRGRWVVVAEMSRRLHRMCELDLTGEDNPLIMEIKAAIANVLAQRHQLQAHAITLTPPYTIPHRSSPAESEGSPRAAILQQILKRAVQAVA